MVFGALASHVSSILQLERNSTALRPRRPATLASPWDNRTSSTRIVYDCDTARCSSYCPIAKPYALVLLTPPLSGHASRLVHRLRYGHEQRHHQHAVRRLRLPCQLIHFRHVASDRHQSPARTSSIRCVRLNSQGQRHGVALTTRSGAPCVCSTGSGKRAWNGKKP